MNTMDLKLNREMLSMTRTILDASCEQAVEKDFLLPDYYPDIFRVLKCVITPTVQSHSINGGKLSFDMAVLIRVLYISQNDKRINCIEQKMNYTKSFDLQGDCGDPMIWLTPKCDYVNCRVVNQRRLDIRGAVTIPRKCDGRSNCAYSHRRIRLRHSAKKGGCYIPSKTSYRCKTYHTNRGIAAFCGKSPCWHYPADRLPHYPTGTQDDSRQACDKGRR